MMNVTFLNREIDFSRLTHWPAKSKEHHIKTLISLDIRRITISQFSKPVLVQIRIKESDRILHLAHEFSQANRAVIKRDPCRNKEMKKSGIHPYSVHPSQNLLKERSWELKIRVRKSCLVKIESTTATYQTICQLLDRESRISISQYLKQKQPNRESRRSCMVDHWWNLAKERRAIQRTCTKVIDHKQLSLQ